MILDANVINDLNGPTEDGLLVIKWLSTGGGGLILGGKLKRELSKSQKLAKFMVELNRAGKLHNVKDEDVDARSEEIKPLCRSNDPHVIAVALISRCRLIFTRDQALQRDAKNRDILSPPAAIYQNKHHKKLLKTCRCLIN